VRAKRKIQEARIPYEVPPPDRLPERLAAVQAVIYLIFNEGYAATSGTELVRNDLCSEAVRLGRVLNELLPRHADNIGLLALMLLQDSRRNARVIDGELITLEEQDRSLWDRGRHLGRIDPGREGAEPRSARAVSIAGKLSQLFMRKPKPRRKPIGGRSRRSTQSFCS